LNTIRFTTAAVVRPIALALAWLEFLASCSILPTPGSDASWVDPQALRSCLGVKVPMDMLKSNTLSTRSIALELTVLPSGRIESVSIIAGSGNATVDNYLLDRFADLACAPFAAIDSTEPYSVELEIDIQAER
jgi:hypothetical protein